MTAEEAELTFIRCPNCRSLIPAIASRCRMCGHQFEKAGSATPTPSADDAQQRSRVRQRTGSASASEVEAIKSQAGSGSSHPTTGSQSGNPSAASGSGNRYAVPPSLEEEAGAKLSSWKEFVSTSEPIADEDIDTTFLKGDSNKERVPTGVLSREKLAADESFESDADIVDAFAWDDAEEGEEEDDFDSDAEVDGGSSPDAVPAGARKRRRRRRRRKGNANAEQAAQQSPLAPVTPTPTVPVPSAVGATEPAAVNSRSSGLPGMSEALAQALSGPASAGSATTPGSSPAAVPFSPAAPPKVAPSIPPLSSVSSSTQRPPVTPPQPAVAAPVSPPPAAVVSPAASGSSAPKSFVAPQQPAGTPVVAQPVQQQVRSEESTSAPKPSISAPRTTEDREMGEGMLVGWLVTFKEDQSGKAIELREGRRFIGRGHLRPTDVVFDHDSISTPHGMIAASANDGLLFQDLMSEKGTYILRSGGKVSDWTQVVNSVQLNHGDRIRFGDYEVLVVLVPR